jgi:16S rRNA (guanine966-N2)-methyltransferase
MRIVSGIAKGRKIIPPQIAEVRPTKDRVREAAFNSMKSFDLIEGRHFFDLFAGSGALGLEALSRGAQKVTFVDHQKTCIDVIRKNLETLGFGDLAEVRHCDYLQIVKTISKKDVVLLDPPYDFQEWDNLLGLLSAEVAVIESSHEISLPSSWREIKSKKYGSTFLIIAERAKEKYETQPTKRI